MTERLTTDSTRRPDSFALIHLPENEVGGCSLGAAEYLNGSNAFGTVVKGKRADLLLIERNPLSDVRCVSKQAGVMVRGRWLTEQEIGKMLEEDSSKPK